MARYVTVSIVAPAPLSIPMGWTPEQQLEEMMAHWKRQIGPVLPEKPDIIVLPEACDRFAGPAASPEAWRAYYDLRGDKMRDMFAQIARDNHCYIAYSAARRAEDGFFRNSTQLIGRDGQVEGIYNKNHLVVKEGPLDGPLPMLCGKDAPVFPLDFGRLGCAICFDLNFDELRHKYMESRPELLLFSSMYHGGFLQQAWAYDCHCWFAGAVAGQDCRIVSPVGEVVASSTNYFPYVTATINLDYAVCYLDENWDKFQAAKAKYGRKVGFHDPGKTGTVLLTSECDDFTAQDLVKEFDIELYDHYFNRCRDSQHVRIEK